nr:PREDICTED: germ cell-specific gene 1-like protein isoform X1 [Lepisosteus oculatus]
MLDHMSRRARSLLSLTLTSLALATSILAFSTSYWCEGTHKVVKPLCLSPVKTKNCGHSLVDFAPGTGASPGNLSTLSAPVIKDTPSNATAAGSTPPPLSANGTSPGQTKEELARIRQRQLANAVHYIWETGEDKYMFRYFHTGFWHSCEKHYDGEKCRSFIELTPASEQGKLTLSAICLLVSLPVCLVTASVVSRQ